MTERAYIPWVILGSGRLGGALVHLANEIGVNVRLVWNRTETRPPAPRVKCVWGDLEQTFDQLGGSVVWITTTDDAISEIAAEIAPYLRPADIVVHASGSLDSRILTKAGIRGPVASVHPLLSINDSKVAARMFSQCAWTIEGDFPALVFARWVLGRIGVEPVEIASEQKVLYHTAAVMSAGLLDALMDAAFTVAEEAGFSSEQSRAMFLPLAHSILTNLEERDTSQALTGPVARGDEETVRRHLRALERMNDPEIMNIYKVLSARCETLKHSPH